MVLFVLGAHANAMSSGRAHRLLILTSSICYALSAAFPTSLPDAEPLFDTAAPAKRSATSDHTHDQYPDYLLGVKYDEYPMIVPKKRAALLIDRLMVALQHAIESEEARNLPPLRGKTHALRADDRMGMDLQRRGHQGISGQKNGRYWRCYFNAVTCF